MTDPNSLLVVPAYGRDYRSRKAVQADWEAGKDFRIASYGPENGRYVNKDDAPAGVVIYARYDRQRKMVRICT